MSYLLPIQTDIRRNNKRDAYSLKSVLLMPYRIIF
jgi:hypothetical protein